MAGQPHADGCRVRDSSSSGSPGGYVHATRHGDRPDDRGRDKRGPSPIQKYLLPSLSSIMSEQKLVKAAETLVQHLVRLRWLEEVPGPREDVGLRLTELGRSLLRANETDGDTDGGVSVVVLGKDDPLAYPTLVGQLAAVGPGLLVDPYLKLEDLHMIVVSTRLTRLLVSDKPPNGVVVSSMRAYLDSASLARRVEVRASTELHDHVLIADDGDLLTVGTSLTGVGRRTTVMTPIPSPARESLKDVYEQLWKDASLVGPQPAEPENDDEGEEGVDERT